MFKDRIKLIVILFSACLTIGIAYVTIAKYSISDISPDNYKIKLKEINFSLSEAGLDHTIPEKFFLSSANTYLTSDNFNNNGVKIINKKTDKGSHIEIHSDATQLNYWLTFEQENLTKVWIFKQALMDSNSPSTALIKELVTNLILKNDFVLKRTELKSGSDFIIKETDDCFIIGSFHSYDNDQSIESVTFSTFSKKRFNVW